MDYSSRTHSPGAVPERFPAAPVDLVMHTWQRRAEMIIGMELRFRHRLDPDTLGGAADALLDAEPLLGCRLVLGEPTSFWERVSEAHRQVLTVTNAAGEYDSIRRSGLRPTEGVPVALCLWRDADDDRLLVKMSHVVGDGAGLQTLVARLGAIYSELCHDPTYRATPSAAGDRDYRQVLSRIPARTYPLILWDFARFTAPRWFPRRTHALPLPNEAVGPWVPVIRRVPAPGLATLSGYGKARGATLNDVFLAAAYRSLAAQGSWDRRSGLRIAITIDLRRWYFGSSERGSIGNLASLEFPFLGRDLGRTFDETLAKVRALTQRRKKSWPGLAPALLQHYFTKGRSYEALLRADSGRARRRNPNTGLPLTFSNEGALDSARLRFGPHVPISAHILPPFFDVPRVHFSLSSYDGSLTIVAVTSQNGESVIGDFLDSLITELPT